MLIVAVCVATSYVNYASFLYYDGKCADSYLGNIICEVYNKIFDLATYLHIKPYIKILIKTALYFYVVLSNILIGLIVNICTKSLRNDYTKFSFKVFP